MPYFSPLKNVLSITTFLKFYFRFKAFWGSQEQYHGENRALLPERSYI